MKAVFPGAALSRAARTLALGLTMAACLGSAWAGGRSYGYFFVGDPNLPAAVLPQPVSPSVVVMGGGPDVDSAFAWMIQRAGLTRGNNGRFVIIRATGTDAYNSYIYESNPALTPWPTVIGGKDLGLGSVETLVIPSVTAANDPFVNSIVARANAVFIAGGDQSDYIKYWKGTKLNDTLNALVKRNAPIGGTSAGLAVLGQFDYAALNGGVTSAQALANPYNKYMTIDPAPQSLNTSTSTTAGGFLTASPLYNSILDAHLDERDRMGRLVTFVSRLVGPSGPTQGCSGGILVPKGSQALVTTVPRDIVARGIGVGVEAALLVQGDGSVTYPMTAKLVTNPDTTTASAAYFLMPQAYASTCAAGKPLSVARVSVNRVDSTVPDFNISTWTGGKATYTLTVTNGVLSSSAGAVY